MEEKDYIAYRTAQELEDGDVVNLGIGIPTKIVDYIPKGSSIHIQSENGILGLGPTPDSSEIDNDLVNAGKQPVTVLKGSSFFDSATSFGMIRGGHIKTSILGVLQVDSAGRVANWAIPGKSILGVGGAMDLLEGSEKVIVTLLHTTKKMEPKIVRDLIYPITSLRKVDLIITELCVFETDEMGLLLIELAPGVSLDTVYRYTEAPFRVSENLSVHQMVEGYK